MADSQQYPPIAWLVEALRAEKIRFLIVRMMSAVIQGAPVVTFDTDIWVDLPTRQYMRLSNLCLKLGATMRANTVFVFPDDTMINFLYAVTGLRSFASEYRSRAAPRTNLQEQECCSAPQGPRAYAGFEATHDE